MAFKLTKTESKTRENLVAELEIAASALNSAVEAYNEAVKAAWEELAPAIEAYNEKVGEAREFAEGIAERAQEEIDGKSDAWRDGDRGTAAQAWQEEWAGVDLSDVEIDEPEELEAPDPAHRDDLENLSEEFDG